MMDTASFRSPSGLALLAGAATIAGFVGYGVGAGEWKGKVNQILVEHERRLNEQTARDNRQDAHMESTDGDVDDLKTTLTTIKYRLGYLVRKAQAGEFPGGSEE